MSRDELAEERVKRRFKTGVNMELLQNFRRTADVSWLVPQNRRLTPPIRQFRYGP